MYYRNPMQLFGGTRFPNLYSDNADGVNEAIDLSTHVATFDFNAPATISFWFKANASHKTSGGFIYGINNNAGSTFFVIGYGNATGTLTNEVISVQYGGSSSDRAGFTDASDTWFGSWHHCVLVCTGSAWLIYLDGISRTVTVGLGSNSGKYGDSITATKVTFGGWQIPSVDFPFAGKLFHRAIWNDALSSGEVSQVYALKGGDYRTLSFGSKLVSAFHFPTGQSGYPTDTDYVGGRNGTMLNQESTDINTDVPT